MQKVRRLSTQQIKNLLTRAIEKRALRDRLKEVTEPVDVDRTLLYSDNRVVVTRRGDRRHTTA